MAQNSIYSLIEKAKQQQAVLSPIIATKSKLEPVGKPQFSFASNLNNINRKITEQPHSKKA